LRVVPRTFSGPIEEDEPFEAMFALGGDEPGRVSDLVAPRIREVFLELADDTDDLAASDQGVTLAWPVTSPPTSDAVLEAGRRAARASALLESSAESLRSSVRLRAHAEALDAYARAHGLGLGLTPIVLEGTVDGVEVVARSERVGWHSHRFTLEARLPAPCDVRLRRASLRDTLEVDVPTTTRYADEAFERRFRLDARGPSDVLADPELRRMLLELDETVGPVSVESSRVRIEFLAIEVRASELPKALDRLVVVAKRLLAR
jgi:hypothetical protein